MSLDNLQEQTHDVFISYSSKNTKIAEAIRDSLMEKGLNCWFAPRNISVSEDYIHQITKGIKSSKIILLVFSKPSKSSKHVKSEIDVAEEYGKRFFVVKIDDVKYTGEVGRKIKTKQVLKAYPDPESKMDSIVETALDLCSREEEPAVIVDLNDIKPSELLKHKQDYASIVLLIIPVLYWASFIYMGIVSSKKLWTIMGCLYSIPLLISLGIYFEMFSPLFVLYPMLILFAALAFIFWILACIHGYIIRNEFLTRKAVLKYISTDDRLFNYLYNRYIKL